MKNERWVPKIQGTCRSKMGTGPDRTGGKGKEKGQSARALIPFKTNRPCVSVSVCVCVQAERAMPGTLLLLVIAMKNADSFSSSFYPSLISVLRLASSRPASSLPPGSSSYKFSSSIVHAAKMDLFMAS
jgi:hypothetical protein